MKLNKKSFSHTTNFSDQVMSESSFEIPKSSWLITGADWMRYFYISLFNSHHKI